MTTLDITSGAKTVVTPTRDPPPPPPRILVVEDDVDIRRLNAKVLAGSGYQVAVLAELGFVEVYSIEIVPELAESAAKRLKALGHERVLLKQRAGYYGWKEYAPFDAIIVTAAPDHLPSPLVSQLAEGGRMVIPIGGMFCQNLVRVRRTRGALVRESLMSVVFVPMTGRGVVINGVTAWLFAAGRHTDLNIRAAFMHMAGDAAVSVGVVIGGIGVLTLGWLWLDPAISLVIVAVIVWGTWDILAESLNMAFDAVPRGVDPHKVREYLRTLPGVTGIHDLHMWAMSTTETALTPHLVIPDVHQDDQFLHDVAEELEHRFRIAHATLQVERGSGPECDQTC